MKLAGLENSLLCEERRKIERAYQASMNLRDSTSTTIDFEPIEAEYTRQYRKAYVNGHVELFRRQTLEYRKLLRFYRAREVQR